ncbi:hypothetical protein [Fibrella forsythiae]|uniref:CopG family transcriptional regulator n=1 Tax=Fibrella forsythiae TaxID=2817061 RepID=A0ABS3JPD5_9BACT|nr:hypothetical protein [Fibrella forsythiae]MBO0951863.1 hypothetical protein [Fibrella forsythiae]
MLNVASILRKIKVTGFEKDTQVRSAKQIQLFDWNLRLKDGYLLYNKSIDKLMSITVEFDETVLKNLETTSSTLNMSSEQLINQIVKNYLHIETVNQLRQDLRGTAASAGFLSEEDIFREIS